MAFDASTLFGAALDDPRARSVLETALPGVAASPMATQLRPYRLGQVARVVPALRDDAATREALWIALAAIDDGAPPPAPPAPAIDPDPDYEPASVARGSARLAPTAPAPRWGAVELELHGPDHGNPFVDVELAATFRHESGRELTAGGFYDGEGVYRIRLLAELEGRWSFRTGSTARSLDGIEGTVEVTPAAEGARGSLAHGPVRVDGLHFRHDDGTRYRPVGTTAYAWTHQPDELRRRTLATLAGHGFTKLRMCLFPKSYLYNTGEPERFPFPREADGGWDTTRFDVAFFRDLEQQVDALAALGIETDLILFHPYDRWGFVDLGAAADERVVRYVVRRLASRASVWWSLANEFDLVWSKTDDDWEAIAATVVDEDEHDHLRSIHNCMTFYDQSKPWITHVSAQRIDVYRTAEEVDGWRERWGKPVVVDECGYEGDIDQGWGNLTGEELVRRCWEGAVRGGYVAHGETYLNDAEELWWSKGGELVGSSPERMAFLDRIVGEAPGGALDPQPSDWDVPWGGVADRQLIGYFGFMRPRFREVVLGEGEWAVDVIDTWAMTIERMPGTHLGSVRVPLPGRQYMAVRLTRVGHPGD